jgi:hypothetical protein
MSSNKAGRFSMLSAPVTGTTGTGLDQLVNAIFADTGLAGANTAPDLLGGAAAANAMNQIILEAAAATGAATDGIFTANEVVAMNAWIRDTSLDGMDHPARRRRGRRRDRDSTSSPERWWQPQVPGRSPDRHGRRRHLPPRIRNQGQPIRQ